MKWINFLHLYQPVNTNNEYIKDATERAYKRIIRGLEEHPNIKFTLNITGCLLLRWEDLGYENLYERLKKLINRGQIELVGSAAYHPILPLLPNEEIIRQIRENESIIKKYLGSDIKLKGFFLPEMAYSAAVAKIIKKLGYKWLILDSFSYRGNEREKNINPDLDYRDSANLKIVFRSRQYSNCYLPDILPKLIDDKKNQIIITATDAEIYGLRHEDPTAEFEKLLKHPGLETQTISEYLVKRQPIKKIKLVASSWESSRKEIKRGLPFAVWQNPENKIQKLLWEFARLALKLEKENRKDKNSYWARWHLVRGLASCTFWWASGKDFRHVFGPVAWNPDEIDKGTNELVRVIRSLDGSGTKRAKIQAERLYIKIKKMVWERHWCYYWRRNF
jgi:predicted glycosyl hydrolase (DUF1957 family)